MDVVLVRNANRMMTTASLLDDGIELSFADGLKGLIPYGEVPEVGNRQGISGLELPNPYEMVLQTAGGESVEIPWDFARHYCDATYRPTVEAIAALGRQTVGEQGAALPGVGRFDPKRLGSRRGHREGYAGEAGERGAVPQVQDPEGGCRRSGDGNPGLAGGPGVLALIVRWGP